ncbi:hypothetical protein GCK32_007908 [Trichostrongylus colubriformis]|uniref:Uncharacterized protein n=1 Tax=Trichostrongylus colubriformis TaxID=6319 RepID=A0AAN8G280_TRICO
MVTVISQVAVNQVKPVGREKMFIDVFIGFLHSCTRRINNRYTTQDIVNTMNGQRGLMTLAICKFEIGDFIDVAITMPGVGPASARRYGSFGVRRNGDDFEDAVPFEVDIKEKRRVVKLLSPSDDFLFCFRIIL